MPARPTKTGCFLCCCLCRRASNLLPGWRALVDEGEIFHPHGAGRPAKSIQLLKDVPQLESAGVVVRTPATSAACQPAFPPTSLGEKSAARLLSAVGQDALLDFRMEVTLDGER